jgi:outer membrane lipase/esterase
VNREVIAPSAERTVMKALRSLVLAAALGVSLPAAAEWSELVVFGDSLSDTGNFQTLTSGLFPSAAFGYAPGRFSNGPVAVEYLAAWLNLPLDNHAVGGARTGTPVGGGSDNFVEDTDQGALLAALLQQSPGWLNGTGIRAQVDDYLAGGGGGADKLYFIWGGPNDYFLPASLTTPATVGNAVGNLQTAITSLYAAGARDFLIPNMPDLGLTPSFVEEGPLAASLASSVSAAHNAALALMLGQLDLNLTDARLRTVDVSGLLNAVVLDPGQYGFTDTGTPCQTLAGCPASPAGYLFWDDVHITTAGHQAVATAFLAAALVPEAERWAMLLAGLSVLGVAGRLQRKRLADDTLALRTAT